MGYRPGTSNGNQGRRQYTQPIQQTNQGGPKGGNAGPAVANTSTSSAGSGNRPAQAPISLPKK